MAAESPDSYPAKRQDGVTDIDAQDRQVLNPLIYPDDSYTAEGVYWGDLPLAKRIGWNLGNEGREAGRELGIIGRMFARDPLSPFSAYAFNYILPGAGLLLEGYVLFSVSNVESLFKKSVGNLGKCWSVTATTKNPICNYNWIAAVTYLETVGILIGQITVGVIGDSIGRRWGLIQDAVVMFLGLVLLTAVWGHNDGFVIGYAWCLFFYSFGVGGEYPMTATIAMESGVGSGKISTREDRLHRGRKIVGAFLMQGWGQLLNQCILIVLLLIFHHGYLNGHVSRVAVQWTYRLSFAIPAIGTLWLVYYRAYHMPAANKQLAIAKKKASVTGYDVRSLMLTFKYFGPRLIATAGTWFMNDVLFYGNKLFQTRFITVIRGSSNLNAVWIWNIINIVVSLVGYYFAMFAVDSKLVGRKWMMFWGFLICFICFVIPTFAYNYLTEPAHIHGFQTLYYLSSFFNQFGPNCVTFLVAAEVYPTSIRATAHGVSAACGKLGALMIAVIGNYTTTQQQFQISCWFGLVGALLTLLFLPDTTGLDLHEQERRWAYMREGREAEYHGVAIHPAHLSWWERLMGKGKYYNAELDYQMKVSDYRMKWEAAMAAREDERDLYEGADDIDDKILHGELGEYFRRTTNEKRYAPNEGLNGEALQA